VSTVADFGDAAVQRRNREGGHTLCEWCGGTGNELYAMYRVCPKCGGDGIAVKYGELSSLGRWWAERCDLRERKRRERELRAPRDWKLEAQWRLSRWFGIGQCFGGYEECRYCHVQAYEVDYDFRRVAPFRAECRDRKTCEEMQREWAA
jgi:hypothetical protein